MKQIIEGLAMVFCFVVIVILVLLLSTGCVGGARNAPQATVGTIATSQPVKVETRQLSGELVAGLEAGYTSQFGVGPTLVVTSAIAGISAVAIAMRTKHRCKKLIRDAGVNQNKLP